MNQKFDFKQFAQKWHAPVVVRTEVGKFSGGLLHPRTMANIDSRGEGPERIRFGKKVAYPVDSLISWMEKRFEGVPA